MILCNDCFPSIQDGAILVFLPGWDNISTLHDLLMSQVMFKSGSIEMYFIAFLRVVHESYVTWFLSFICRSIASKCKNLVSLTQVGVFSMGLPNKIELLELRFWHVSFFVVSPTAIFSWAEKKLESIS